MTIGKYCEECKKETEWAVDDIFEIMSCTRCGRVEILAEQIAPHRKYWLKSTR